MLSNDANLIAHLLSTAQDELLWVELYTLELRSGDVLRFTTADYDVRRGGQNYYCDPLSITRGTTRVAVGFAVDTMPLEFLTSDSTAILNGLTLQELMERGWMRGAKVTVERWDLETYDVAPSWDPVVIFYGIWADGVIGRTKCTADVNSGMDYLQNIFPREVLQSSCRYPGGVYSAGCGLNPAAFAVHCTIEAGSNSVKLIDATHLVAGPGYFPLGYVLFTSGLNSGLAYGVRGDGPGYLVLDSPTLAPPQIGDTFDAFPGCDLTENTCDTKFGNLANNGGMKNIPPPEQAL